MARTHEHPGDLPPSSTAAAQLDGSGERPVAARKGGPPHGPRAAGGAPGESAEFAAAGAGERATAGEGPRALDVEGRAAPPAEASVAGAATASFDDPTATMADVPRAGRASLELFAGATVKHYEVVRPLGSGGMGSVFLARDTKLGRLVALKLLLEGGEEHARRLVNEARVTARCRHENIVVIHDVDELDGRPYLVLEYLEGQTLRDWLDGRERPGPGVAVEPATPALAVELMRPVVRALACAHAHGIVHRDLKPANVVLTDAGPVKVLDFGIAKQAGAGDLVAARRGASEAGGAVDELTRPGAVLGTLQYMAPEQWRGEAVDARADLWAVGVMLFRLAAGAHPLDPCSLADLAAVALPDVPMPRAAERLPGLGPLADVIDRCLAKAPAERFGSADELLAALDALAPARAARVAGEDEAGPFAGLVPLQEGDAGRFFGRDREVTAALGRLRAQPLLAVAGPSGAGKSSFVRAGVIPAWRRAHPLAEARTLRPGRRPLAALAELLAELGEAEETGAAPPAERGGDDERTGGEPAGRTGERTGGEPAARTGERTAGEPAAGAVDESGPEGERRLDKLAARLAAFPGRFGARLRAHCRRRGPARRLLVFVDQFEELYTLGAPPDERAAFAACLLGAADDPSSPLRVVLSARSDFLDRAAEDGALAAELGRGLLLLPPVGAAGLHEALARPLEAAGYRFEDDAFARAMVSDLAGARCPLPLLQFTAAQLWRERDPARRLLTRASYERLGGVGGALSAHADATLAAFGPDERALCRAVLLRLVTPERTRAVVGAAELEALGGAPGAAARVLGRLADARLVLVTPAEGGEGPTAELVHESLIERWGTLAHWLDESAHDAQFVGRLRAAARQWHEGGEAEGLLWRDRAADEARAWRARQGEAGARAAGLGEREERFVRAVGALAGRSRRRRRALVGGAFAAVSAAALAVSTLAWQARREAGRAGREAERARAEAERADRQAAAARNVSRLSVARELLADDPTAALGLLREVEPPEVPREWAELARQALYAGVSAAVLEHPDLVIGAAFDPEGRRVVTACWDGLVRVWNVDGRGEPVVLRGHEGHATSAVFSPDGSNRIASSSFDGTVRVWNADGSGEPLVLRGHEGPVRAVEFSPDGARLVSASADGTARVWRADGRGEPVVLRGHADRVIAASFSPDGRSIVTASDDKTARVWPADGRGPALVLRGHGSWVNGAAFGPDGSGRIATTSSDRTLRVWDARAPAKPPLVYKLPAGANSVAFSPDGRYVLITDGGGAVRLFGAEGAGELAVLRGHANMANAARFGPGGRLVVSASDDKTVRVWDADLARATLALGGHEETVGWAAFSPDGRRVATASSDRKVRLWGADGAGRPAVLGAHAQAVTALAFSPDGRRVASASEDKTVRVWPADGKGPPVVLRGHGGMVMGVAFSPDGARLASAAKDRTARAWRADGRGEPVVLRGHDDWVNTAAFSPDGRSIVTASDDKTVRVWPADGAGAPLVLRGDDMFNAAEFSPDGARIVAASVDRAVRVWPADGRGEPLVLRGHDGEVNTVAFSPDGRSIVTASDDKTVRVWPADGRGPALVLRGHAEAVMQAAFAPDGARVVSASVDKTARVWAGLDPPPAPGDDALWRASSHCLPPERRAKLLQQPAADARAAFEACERRARAARGPAVVVQTLR